MTAKELVDLTHPATLRRAKMATVKMAVKEAVRLSDGRTVELLTARLAELNERSRQRSKRRSVDRVGRLLGELRNNYPEGDSHDNEPRIGD